MANSLSVYAPSKLPASVCNYQGKEIIGFDLSTGTEVFRTHGRPIPTSHMAVRQPNTDTRSPHLRSTIKLEAADLHLTEKAPILVTLSSSSFLTPCMPTMVINLYQTGSKRVMSDFPGVLVMWGRYCVLCVSPGEFWLMKEHTHRVAHTSLRTTGRPEIEVGLERRYQRVWPCDFYAVPVTWEMVLMILGINDEIKNCWQWTEAQNPSAAAAGSRIVKNRVPTELVATPVGNCPTRSGDLP
ncbi:hypothetical protein BJ322DRAFT_1017882 [Thelephora terrestris]|uniref:Uncharacterized protein n=1 Tax=Thelephora terrestris TaxID=56493 RepID=A0A9P6HN74_9AGAM|nr:hypothetical protein BJ322DRAFT_1017882 [Thelephora terrestris]